jgi:hypothetical protein
MLAARRLEVGRLNVGEAFVPDVEERLASFALPYGSPSWLAALESVFDAWLAAGELAGADRALAQLQRASTRPGATTLSRATHALLAARLEVARGDDPAWSAERSLEGARASRAPWWAAKALRLLATPAALDEAAELERGLGIPAT